MPGFPPQFVGEGFPSNKQRKEVKVNLVQLKMDWVSLPNIRNGTYIGRSDPVGPNPLTSCLFRTYRVKWVKGLFKGLKLKL